MLEGILQKDTELFLFLNSLGTVTWDGFWLVITNKLLSVPIYLILTFLLYKKLGLKKTIVFVVFGILLITFSDQLANLFKHGFKRLRPCRNETLDGLVRLIKSHCGGQYGYGYFSAHASTGMALAIFFSNMLKSTFKYIFYPLVCLALFIGYSRIYVGVHYPLDVITGFLIGGVSGCIFYKLCMIFTQKYIRT